MALDYRMSSRNRVVRLENAVPEGLRRIASILFAEGTDRQFDLTAPEVCRILRLRRGCSVWDRRA